MKRYQYSSDLRTVYERMQKREADERRGLVPPPDKNKSTNPTLEQLTEMEENTVRFLISMASFTSDGKDTGQNMLDRLYPKVDPKLKSIAEKYLDNLLATLKSKEEEAKLQEALLP